MAETAETEKPTPKGKLTPAQLKAEMQAIADEWNKLQNRLPGMEFHTFRAGLTKSCIKKARLRLADPDWRAQWREAIVLIPGSSFLSGGRSERAWMASCDWFLQTDSVDFLLGGKYRFDLTETQATEAEEDDYDDGPPLSPEYLKYLGTLKHAQDEYYRLLNEGLDPGHDNITPELMERLHFCERECGMNWAPGGELVMLVQDENYAEVTERREEWKMRQWRAQVKAKAEAKAEAKAKKKAEKEAS